MLQKEGNRISASIKNKTKQPHNLNNTAIFAIFFPECYNCCKLYILATAFTGECVFISGTQKDRKPSIRYMSLE